MNRYGKWIAAMSLAIAVVTLAVAVSGAVGLLRDRSQPRFAWLRPGAAPSAWAASELPGSPARLPVPPGWRGERGDAGTRSEVLRGPSGRIAGYLNATPRQGSESLANWTEFRLEHNREEGDREVTLLSGATDLSFLSASGSCVLDSYRTQSGNRYREIACIVAGRSATTVIVGAAPPRIWQAEAPDIEQAIDSFRT